MNITTKNNPTSTKVTSRQPTSKTHRHALRGLSTHTGTRAGAGLRQRIRLLEDELLELYDTLQSKGILR
jgi:hypothetical protein